MIPTLIPLALQIIGTLTGTSGTMNTIVAGGKSILDMLTGINGEAVAGKVISTAKQMLGTSDPAEIARLTAQDKQKADVILAKINQDVDEYRIQVADTSDARARDLTKFSNGQVNTRANVMLVGNFLSIVFIVMGLVWWGDTMPAAIAAILGGLVGNLATMLTQAYNFEFGSSRGSSESRVAIGEALAKAVNK